MGSVNHGPGLLRRAALPLLTVLVVGALLSVLIPVGDTLWAKILYISGSVETSFEKGQGCTPGFWKQEHHFDSWPAPYAPDDLFKDALDIEVDSDLTLVEALRLQGGGENALMRHTVAALLNATSPDVAYLYSTGQVIEMFQTAVASGDPDLIEETKDLFDDANEKNCPLPIKKPKREVSPTPTAEAPQKHLQAPTSTPTPTATDTPTATPTATATNRTTATSTATSTATETATEVSSPTMTMTPTATTPP